MVGEEGTPSVLLPSGSRTLDTMSLGSRWPSTLSAPPAPPTLWPSAEKGDLWESHHLGAVASAGALVLCVEQTTWKATQCHNHTITARTCLSNGNAPASHSGGMGRTVGTHQAYLPRDQLGSWTSCRRAPVGHRHGRNLGPCQTCGQLCGEGRQGWHMSLGWPLTCKLNTLWLEAGWSFQPPSALCWASPRLACRSGG